MSRFEQWAESDATLGRDVSGAYQAHGAVKATRWAAVTLINAAFPDLQPVLRLHLGCRCRPTDAHFDVQAALDGFSCCRAVRDYAIAGLPPRR
jgi:hypothetical protein